MTRPPDGPDPRDVRAWLARVAAERWDPLVSSAMRSPYVKDPSVAPDLVQDAMLKILAGEVELPDDANEAWRRLVATIRNLTRNHGRSARIRRAAPLEAVRPSPSTVWEGRGASWRICERLELEEAVAAALERLTPARREVVWFRYFDDATIAEIAEARECSPSTVKDLLRKALAELRRELEGPFVP